jgi:CRP-like cAMP-binding protein
MPATSESFGANNLLGALPKSDFDLLSSKFELKDLVMEEVLQEPNKQVEYAYFPTSGICSVIAGNVEGVQAETGLIGREGFVGLSIVLFADQAPSKVIVQAAGRALRIKRSRLLKAIGESPSLQAALLRFVHTFSVQVSQTAVANGHYKINQRLARWLLMCQDRADSHEFPMTHKFLSVMLAVRRAGITDALSELEGLKCIRALRGRILITDRKCLEQIAGAAYGIPESEYRRLLS